MSQSAAQGYLAKLKTASDGWGMTKADADAKRKQLTAQVGAATANIDTTGTVVEDYLNAYTPEYDRGYTGAEVESKISSTPGYKFQMDQGTKAIERQGAASGMLGSGGTLTALTKYGQGLAQNFYGIYMDNLQRITQDGSGATMQIAQNQINQGKDYGALVEMGGAAGQRTAQMIGDSRANSLYKRGELYSNAAQFNASMQYQGIEGEKNREAKMMQTALSSAGNIMSAQNDANKFNYGVFQNQQGGQAYTGARL